MVHRTDRSSASFLVPSARQWLARRLAGWIALQLPSSFLCSSVACLTACQVDRSPASFLVPSARQWLARWLLGRIAHRLTSSFLPLVSGFPHGLTGGSLFGFLPRSFRSSVACPTACRVDRSSASFLVPSARQWLTRRLLRRIAHRLISSFLLLLGGSPDGSLIGLLPRFF